MDLTPLYELRDRLKAGAIAGTALLGEDFRLARALEALAPLEGASPVFQKIGQGVRALLAADCPDRAAALLDALSLCDAVRTTQGAVGVGGTVEPMPLTARGSALTNAPYSVLQPLTEALTSSGGGRYSFIVDTHDQRPALFQDYRVKHALVAALGGSYSELADRAEEWLSAAGPELVPLLKAGFNPMGKREMVRRIHVMEAVAGAAENDFYRALLEGTCEKEVRAAAVYALRHDEGNAETLVALCKTEKGLAKKAAHWALARMSSPTAWAYWDALAEKKPEQVADYMVLSTAPKANLLVAQCLLRLLEPYETNSKADIPANFADKLQRLMQALPGKHGPEICDFYRRAAALGAALDRPAAGEKRPLQIRCANYQSAMPFSSMVPSILTFSIFYHATADLADLAGELYARYGLGYAAPHVMSALLTKGAGEAFQAGRAMLNPPVSIFKKGEQQQCQNAMKHTIGAISWSHKEMCQVVSLPIYDPATERCIYPLRPLAEALDMQWYDTMISKCDIFGDYLFHLTRPDSASVRTRLGGHLYSMAKLIVSNEPYCIALREMRWETCEGLAVRRFTGKQRIRNWEIVDCFHALPGSPEAKAQEAERLLALAKKGDLGFAEHGVEVLQRLITDLRGPEAHLHTLPASCSAPTLFESL